MFSAGSHCDRFWHRQECPLFGVVHPAFPLPTKASPALQGALKDGFGKAVEACDMSDPCHLPSLDSCQKRFLWTHKDFELAPYPVVGLVLQVGDTEKFPYALGLVSKAWILFSESFKMKCLRELLRTSYSEHKTNDWVRSKINSLVGPQEHLLATVKRWKLAWSGHVTRHNILSRTILQGTLEGCLLYTSPSPRDDY